MMSCYSCCHFAVCSLRLAMAKLLNGHREWIGESGVEVTGRTTVYAKDGGARARLHEALGDSCYLYVEREEPPK